MHCGQLVCLFLGFFILLLIDNAQALEGEAIIGGDDAIFGEFPYQASLQIYGKNFCGGGIIDDYHVVTAAHCVADSDGELHNYSIKIVAGIIDLGTEASTKITCNVEKVFIPKEFGHTDPKTRRIGDISVLKLKEPLNIQSNNLRKLELPEDKTYADEMAIVTGYGWNWVDVTMNALTERAEESGGSHQKLRFANAKVLSSAECQKNYVKNIAKQNICARVVQRQPSKPEGVCSGDSGGPLVHGGKTLIGIVSTSPVGCKETKAAAVYTRVSSYLDFIDKARKDQPDDTMLTTKLPISLWF